LHVGSRQTPQIKEELPKHTIVRETISTTAAEARERERERERENQPIS
jgi:hypothetical protein